jgi:hypothetical protein
MEKRISTSKSIFLKKYLIVGQKEKYYQFKIKYSHTQLIIIAKNKKLHSS